MDQKRKNTKHSLAMRLAALVLCGCLCGALYPAAALATEAAAVSETTATPEPTATPENAAESAPTVVYSAAADGVTVKAEAAEGVLPAGAALSVAVLDGTDKDAAAAELDSSGVQYDGFMALDLKFTDAEGNEIEPEGAVSVSFALTELPEDADTATLAVQHLEEDAAGEVTAVSTVANTDTADEETGTVTADEAAVAEVVETINADTPDEVEVNADETAAVAEFTVDEFSTFTITYKYDGFFSDSSYPYYADVVDATGKKISTDNSSVGYITIDKSSESNEQAHYIQDDENGAPSSIYGTVEGETTPAKYNYTRAEIKINGTWTEFAYVKVTRTSGWSSKRALSFYDANGNELLQHERGESKPEIRLVYTKEEKEKPAAPTEVQPGYEKYIAYNESTDTYDLTLNVIGSAASKTKKAKVDILFVLDVSGSMNNNNKLTNAKNGINSLVDKLSTPETTGYLGDTIDAQYKLVTFSSSATVQTEEWVNGRTIESRISRLSADGGTNYQDALVKAGAAVATKSSNDAQTIVVFLTDGTPQRCLMSSTNWSTYNSTDTKKRIAFESYGWNYYILDNDKGGSTNLYNTLGIGTEANKDEYGLYYQGALMGADTITSDKFYSIGYGLSGNTDDNISSDVSPRTAKQLLMNVAGATHASTTDTMVIGAGSDDLTKVLDKIAAETSYINISNVTITDTLSEYAEVSSNDAKVTITVTDKDGNEQGKAEGKISSLPTLTLTDDGKGYEITATYDKDSKQIKLIFPTDYTLHQDWTYSITVNIKPTAKAYSTFASSGYNNVGDANTDAKDSTTSSGKTGFRSNADEKATLSYTVTNREPATATYKHPVIQVKTGDLKITKAISGLPEGTSVDQEFTFTVQASDASKVSGNYPFFGSDGTTVKGTATFENGEATVTITGADTIVIKNLPLDVTYTVTEIDPTGTITTDSGSYGWVSETYTVDDGDPSTTSGAARISSTQTTSTVTVTNTYQPAPDTPYIRVQKTFTGLTQDQINKLTNFAITVNNSNGEPVGTLTLDDKTPTKDSSGNIVYTWKLPVDGGTYDVTESGETFDGYTVKKSGAGTVATADSTLDIGTPKTENSGAEKDNEVGTDTNYVIVSLTSPSGYFVWTKEPLSASARAAMISAINGDSLKQFNTGEATDQNTYFYSADILQTSGGFKFREGTISLNNGVLRFTNKNQWNKFAYGTYTKADNPEISVSNAYTPQYEPLTVTKTVSGPMGDTSADFTFTMTLTKDGKNYTNSLSGTKTGTGITSEKGDTDTYAAASSTYTFTLKSGQTITFEKLPYGYTAVVKETSTGDGYTTTATLDGETKTDAATNGVSAEMTTKHDIVYTNTRDIVTPTGITTDTTPYAVMILAGVLALGGGAVLTLRRKREG